MKYFPRQVILQMRFTFLVTGVRIHLSPLLESMMEICNDRAFLLCQTTGTDHNNAE